MVTYVSNTPGNVLLVMTGEFLRNEYFGKGIGLIRRLLNNIPLGLSGGNYFLVILLLLHLGKSSRQL